VLSIGVALAENVIVVAVGDVSKLINDPEQLS